MTDRELDALIAEKVMGWECGHRIGDKPRDVLIAEFKAYWLKEYGHELSDEKAAAICLAALKAVEK